MEKQIFDTDIINHNGKEITVTTYTEDARMTEEFTRKGFKFVVSGEGQVLTMWPNGKHPRRMTEAQKNMVLMFKERCLYQAVLNGLTYTFSGNGDTFSIRDKEECCNTATEQMSLIDVADWMISQF